MTKNATGNTHSTKKAYKPGRILWLFAIAAIILVPWTVWLAHSLPPAHLDRRWEVAWSGFDVGELIALALTAYLGMRKSPWIIIVASIAGTLLLTDAWFDCITATTGREYAGSLASATLVELPLSFLAFRVAYRAAKNSF